MKEWQTIALSDAIQTAIETQEKLNKAENQKKMLIISNVILICAMLFIIFGK